MIDVVKANNRYLLFFVELARNSVLLDSQSPRPTDGKLARQLTSTMKIYFIVRDSGQFCHILPSVRTLLVF